MAPETGRAGVDLNDRLLAEPQRFDFFQAVRLLEWVVRERLAHGERRPWEPPGGDVLPEREFVHFRALPSLGFPVSPVAAARLPAAQDGVQSPPAEMVVAFLGLTGPSGVLPEHYTTLLLRRLRDKDATLRDFLDLFNHRLTSLFFRAWEKYRLPFAHERVHLGGAGKEDLPTWAIFCLVGLGTDGLRRRQSIDDQAFLYFAGHFANQQRTAIALEAILEDYFEMPIRVLQLHGQWLILEATDQSSMPGLGCPEGRNIRLGLDAVVGERVWDVQSKFRLRVGPLNFSKFRQLMPSGDALRALCQMTRCYVGPEFDFDVQAVLMPSEVPWCRLADEGAQLGWNTWVRSQPFDQEVDDAVFSTETLSGPDAPSQPNRVAAAPDLATGSY
jgi:type VI secretion system protein ImpH